MFIVNVFKIIKLFANFRIMNHNSRDHLTSKPKTSFETFNHTLNNLLPRLKK